MGVLESAHLLNFEGVGLERKETDLFHDLASVWNLRLSSVGQVIPVSHQSVTVFQVVSETDALAATTHNFHSCKFLPNSIVSFRTLPT